MSPLARLLFALACAALLRASSADADDDDPDIRPPVTLKQGIVDDKDKHFEKRLVAVFATPKNSVDFTVDIPNKANKNEALVGQVLHIVDPTGQVKTMTVKPVNHEAHSPLKVHCEPGCLGGVKVNGIQYVIKNMM